MKVFCSEQSSSRGGIEIAQLVADWLITLPLRTCVKPPVTSDCSLAPKLLFVDWLEIVANEKQAVQFRSSTVLVCEARQQPTNKEYRPRLPQQGQIAVSPWPRPQHQYVKKRFF